jgi:uncharacterized protein YjbI with pentapeptide repeats
MKISLTGASGLIGGSVGTRLVAAGHRVRGLVRDPAKARAVCAAGVDGQGGPPRRPSTAASSRRPASARWCCPTPSNNASMIRLLFAGRHSLFINFRCFQVRVWPVCRSSVAQILFWLILVTAIVLTIRGASAYDPEHVQRLREALSCEHCNLSNADLTRANLAGARLTGANLAGARLAGANLAGARLAGANLAGATLLAADLRKTNLSFALAHAAPEAGSDLQPWNEMLDAQGRTNLQGARLSNARMGGANLNGANLAKADLSFADLREASLIGANFAGADLVQADLESAELSFAKLEGATLSDVNLQSAQLPLANLNEARLSGARLGSARLSEANLRGAQLESADLEEADLIKADFRGARLLGANLERAKLHDANLEGANLFQANLRHADLIRTNFEKARIAFADVAEAVYTPIGVPDAYVEGIKGLVSVVIPFGDTTALSGLVLLRDLFQKAGLRDSERVATFVIEHHGTRRLIFYENEPLAWTEGMFRLVAFEWPVAYGLQPGRALLILLGFIGAFALVYAFALARGIKGIYRIRPEKRLELEAGVAKVVGQAEVDALLPRSFWVALGPALQFSLLSAFHIGFREFSVGTWLARLQSRQYTLEALGWIRSLSGLQSLLSVYLLAMWALTYFGRPFQ